MNQPDFIFFIKSLGFHGEYDIHGNILVKLNPTIHLNHNYRQRDLITIRLVEYKSKYIIPDRTQLEVVCRIYLENVNVQEMLYKHCEAKYTKTKN